VAARPALEGRVTTRALPRHWASADERTFAAGIRFLLIVYRVFGRTIFRFVVFPTVLFYIATDSRARAASREYLARVYRALGRPTSDVGAGAVLRHFSSFAECVIDKVRIWSDAADALPVEFHGREAVAEQIALGRGGLIMTSHLGNIELCRVLSKQRPGLRITVLVHTKNARVFNQLLAELNPESALNLMQVTELTPEAAILIGQKVDAGEFVVMAGDRVPVSPRPRVAIAKLLGDRAAFPVGPYILGGLLQCPIYLMFCLRRGAEYHVHYELFRDRIDLPRRDRVPALAALASAYAARLEHYCLEAPFEWFNFYDFWAEPESGWNDV
jgi:predicted LPLAT superfamily acyltransferase